MDSARTKLVKGSIKSASAALTGTTLGTSVMGHFNTGIDPSQWNTHSWIGIKHNLVLGIIIVAAAEIRYIWQWVKKWANSEGTLSEALDVAKEKTVEASKAIEDAKSQVIDQK